MATGPLQALFQLGGDLITVKPKRNIASFTAQCTIEEVHQDELEIVDHPVELGAPVTDHAYRRPAHLVVTVGYSNSPSSSNIFGSLANTITGTIGGLSSLFSGNSVSQVKDIYEKFLFLQNARTPFEVNTGKRLYQNMLVKSLQTTTTKETENSLILRVELREILIAVTQLLTYAAPTSAQKSPEVTTPITDAGTKQLVPATTYNAGAGRGSINPASVVPQ